MAIEWDRLLARSKRRCGLTHMHIRPVCLTDAAQYRSLRNGENTYRWFFSQRRFSLEEVRSWLSALRIEKEEIFVAEENGRLIATCSIYDIDPLGKTAEVGRIIVDEKMRQKGIGSQIMKFVMDRCRQLGLKRVCANIMESNTASQSLFEAAGFRRVRLVSERGFLYERDLGKDSS